MTKKQLEAELRKAQERIAQLKDIPGELAGSIANDFNNLLVAIVAGAELSLRDLPAFSPVREHVEIIMSAAQGCALLTEQLLDYSGGASFFVESVDLSSLLDDLRRQFESKGSEKINIKIDVPPTLPSIVGDVQQLEHLITILVDNAMEAIGDEQGEISVSASVGSNSERAGTCIVTLEVTDSGCGMNAETRERMFEPCFTTKAGGKGMGLGAAEGILRGHSASVDVESELGKGTTLRLCFSGIDEETQPAELQPDEAQAGKAKPGDGHWAGSGSILVIDDESIVRTVTAKVLSRMGFDVITATNGRDGLRCFDEHNESIVLVLLDLVMPEMGGQEAFTALRKKQPRLPILVSSGQHDEATLQWIKGSEFADFIHKPFSIPELQSKLQSMLPNLSAESG